MDPIILNDFIFFSLYTLVLYYECEIHDGKLFHIILLHFFFISFDDFVLKHFFLHYEIDVLTFFLMKAIWQFLKVTMGFVLYEFKFTSLVLFVVCNVFFDTRAIFQNTHSYLVNATGRP